MATVEPKNSNFKRLSFSTAANLAMKCHGIAGPSHNLYSLTQRRLMPRTEGQLPLSCHPLAQLAQWSLRAVFPPRSKCKAKFTEPLKPKQEILTSLPTPQQSMSFNKLVMLCKKKAVKLCFLASARLKDLAVLTTLKLPTLATANHNLGQIPAAVRSQQDGRH